MHIHCPLTSAEKAQCEVSAWIHTEQCNRRILPDPHGGRYSNTLHGDITREQLRTFPTPTDFTVVTSHTKQYDPVLRRGVHNKRHSSAVTDDAYE